MRRRRRERHAEHEPDDDARERAAEDEVQHARSAPSIIRSPISFLRRATE
jgi:hypothetical protein